MPVNEVSIVTYASAVVPPPTGAGIVAVGTDVYPLPPFVTVTSLIVSSAIIGLAVAPSDKFALSRTDLPPVDVSNTPVLLITISFDSPFESIVLLSKYVKDVSIGE